ncbi:MAG: 3-phosphoshikimate 1-carboxyvinyltransferase [Firmicutes bacterium HGW-Firmicutes-21]|nr:MAG: 3-phosphoshikimate 1-carboxyvinyltransferase [Firmicutes bacterium HGW-Firmicutes-21]
MTVRITPSPLYGRIRAIPSKSVAHRAFICAVLSGKPSVIVCDGMSRDIEATINCLNALGAKIKSTDNVFEIIPIDKDSNKKASLDCGESGSTLRFILPLVSALGRNAEIYGYGRLPERPLTPLTKELISHGAYIGSSFPLECGGRLDSGHFKIAGNISSQFISGLLLAAPLIGDDCFIELTTELESKPYIDITVAVMASYGVKVEYRDNGYFVKNGQSYTAPSSYEIEGDWSNAAFWLTCAALGGNGITLDRLTQNSLQGDRAVCKILAEFGAIVTTEDNTVTVSPAPLKGIDINAANIPDLVPVLAVAACGAIGQTRFFNASRLRLKESDRLLAVSDVLGRLGADIIQIEDGLIINGTGVLKGGRADAMGDHRIAMSLAVAALICKDDVIIDNAETAEKSYPAFFEHYRALNGRVSIIN